MSCTVQIFKDHPGIVEAGAERVAADLHENLLDYLSESGRDSFTAHFPVGISKDRVNDLAHQNFLDSLGVRAAGDGYLIFGEQNHKLFYNVLHFDEAQGGGAYHIIYSSEPFIAVEA